MKKKQKKKKKYLPPTTTTLNSLIAYTVMGQDDSMEESGCCNGMPIYCTTGSGI
jgi:hypothetical protein